MVKSRILVVEDDKDISELVCHTLQKDGYDVSAVYNGLHACEYAQRLKPNLIVLDLMIPEIDGLEVCRRLKSNPDVAHIPIVILTAKAEEEDMLVGLQMQADDYIAKPFSPKILLARIKAIFRRIHAAQAVLDSPSHRELGSIIIDTLKHRVVCRGVLISVTMLEFKILEFLSRSPGRVYTREQILDGVWQEGKYIVDRAVDVHIRGLRKKLGLCQDYIETVRGLGYRFKEDSFYS